MQTKGRLRMIEGRPVDVNTIQIIGQTLMDVLDYLEIIDLGLNLSATALHQLKEKQNG